MRITVEGQAWIDGTAHKTHANFAPQATFSFTDLSTIFPQNIELKTQNQPILISFIYHLIFQPPLPSLCYLTHSIITTFKNERN